MNTDVSQCDKVLKHMKTVGPINQLVALRQYGIMRLASRITDLRRQGERINDEWVRGRKGKRWKQYSISRG